MILMNSWQNRSQSEECSFLKVDDILSICGASFWIDMKWMVQISLFAQLKSLLDLLHSSVSTSFVQSLDEEAL